MKIKPKYLFFIFFALCVGAFYIAPANEGGFNRSAINRPDKNGLTPIFYAAASGKLELIEKLIESGADPDFESSHGFTPIIYSLAKRKYESAIKLIQEGANPDKSQRNGYTPLIYALEKADKAFIPRLIRNGASPNLVAGSGYSPLLYAIELGNLDLAKILVENGADIGQVSPGNDPPLASAIMKKRNGIAKYFVRKGADVNLIDGERRTPLVYAASSGNYEMAEYLLKHGARPNIKGLKDFPLQTAISFGEDEITRMLIEYGADPELTDYKGMNALDVRVTNKNQKAVRVAEEAIFEKYWLKEWGDFENIFSPFRISRSDFKKYGAVATANFFNKIISPQNPDSEFGYIESRYSFQSPEELISGKKGDCDELSSLLANMYNQLLGIPLENLEFVIAHGQEVKNGYSREYGHSALIVFIQGDYYLADPANNFFYQLRANSANGRLEEAGRIFARRLGPHLKIESLIYKPLVSLFVNQILNRNKPPR